MYCFVNCASECVCPKYISHVVVVKITDAQLLPVNLVKDYVLGHQLSVVYCCAGRLIGHNLLNFNTNSLLMMNGAQSPLPSPHAGRVSSPAPLISAAPGNFHIASTSFER